MIDFFSIANKFQNWTRQYALPVWAVHARDDAGGYYEQLFLDGRPDVSHTRRVRVQARHSYVYAHAATLGWFDGARQASDHAWQYLTTHGFQGGETIAGNGFKGCAYLLNADGSLRDGMRDTYTQAFVILAGAWRFIAFADNQSLDIANATLNFLDKYLMAENGGWHEGIPVSLPRRQNPHMHLFEALIALYDATGDEAILLRAEDIFELFKRSFFNKERGEVAEFFNQDWSIVGDNGGPIEPGHMMEWCWLLRAFEDRSGIEVGLYADTIYENALNIGLNADLGLICDVVVRDKGIEQATYRTWPQTEFIKASIAQAKAGRIGMVENASMAIQALFDNFMNVDIQGGWIDKVNAKGIVVEPVMPTSTFYHLLCCAAEVSNFAGNLNAK